jgi:hypothetical protein
MSKIKASIIEDITQVEDDLPPRPQRPQRDYSGQNLTQIIRQKINNMYANFLMTKTDQHGPYGIYKALVDSLTTGDSKYVVAIVPNDQSPIGIGRLLSVLQWICFQTRTTDNLAQEFHNLEVYPQFYSITSANNVSDTINLLDERKSHYLYRPENLPLKIEILKLKETDTFAERGTVTSALELYQTVLTIEN